LTLLLAVFVGGAAGALARHAVTVIAQLRAKSRFPSGTLAVNLLGCAILGLLLPHLDPVEATGATGVLLTTGAVGAFTTFSTLAADVVALYSAGRRGTASLYLLGTLLLGVVAFAGGLAIGEAVSVR